MRGRRAQSSTHEAAEEDAAAAAAASATGENPGRERRIL